MERYELKQEEFLSRLCSLRPKASGVVFISDLKVVPIKANIQSMATIITSNEKRNC